MAGVAAVAYDHFDSRAGDPQLHTHVVIANKVLTVMDGLPATINQFQALFGFGARPVRLDFLVFVWAAVPWLYRQDDPFRWLRPSTWQLGSLTSRQDVDRRVREFLGLEA